MSKNSLFPPQKLPLSKKDKAWKETSLESIIARYSINDFRKHDMKIAYDIMNSEFDLEDLKYVTDPFKAGIGFPARIQNINIIRPKIELLKGEETKRPDSIVVFRTDEDAVESLVEVQKEMLYRAIEESLISPNIENDEQQMQFLQQRLKEIKKYITNEHYDPAEQTALKTLKYLKEKLDLKDEFLKGFEDALVAGEEVYYTGIINGEPVLERVNPLNCAFDRDPNLKYLDDGEWFVRHEWMTPSAVYDRFYDIMDEADLDEMLSAIQNGGRSGRASNTGSQLNTSYIQFKELPGSPYSQDDYRKGAFISVSHGVWKSYKKIGYLMYMDPETGEMIEDIVDETYKPVEGEDIVWDWIIEWWEGYRIGENIYLGINPVEYQDVSIDNPNARRGPYTGGVYNYNNAAKKSLVEIMKPLQYIYLILWYRLELTLARDKGKILNMDMTQIPKGLGVDEYKWMHYLTAMGINFINPYDEGWCFAPGTKVLMFDGTRKNIEEIKINEKVMGPDGLPRSVLELHSGIDHMYKITPSTGSNTHVVNSRHQVVYNYRESWKNVLTRKFSTPEELILEFRDNPSRKDHYYLERASDVVTWDSDLEVDPYLLGLWLGDGFTGETTFESADYEVINYLKNYADTHGMRATITPSKNSKSFTIYLANKDNTKKGGKKYKNILKDKLLELGVLYNKHVPDKYIYTSRHNRLQLLAGLIDTDGSVTKTKKNKIIEFSQCEERQQIVDAFTFIARSLGFKVSESKIKSTKIKIYKNKNYTITQPAYRSRIYHGKYTIPTLIERKQFKWKDRKVFNENMTTFDVEYDGVGKYYGFSTDGDHLFLLDDFTIVHNSIPGREGGKPASFNQITAVDTSMTNVIVEYIQLMEKVESMIGELSGVSKARQGQIHQRSLVGNVEREVIQSSHITEPLFWRHNQIKRRALTNLLNVAKFAYKYHDKKSLNFIFKGTERMFINITEDFVNSDYDVFLTDSTKEYQDIQTLQGLYQPAMQNGATLLDIASIMTEDNMSEIKTKLADIEQRRMEMMQSAQEAEQAMVQQETMMKQEELRIKEEDSIRKAETAITVAMIGAENNVTEEVVDDDDSMEREKLDVQKEKVKKDYEMKKKQLDETIRSNKAKETIARSKPKTTSIKK